ncbi:MAG: LacI family DNA-binding transcriptional regulator [Faecousia sp.]
MTIKDLAEITGYAVGTVSRALNGHPNVSEKARQTILQAAQECGFELNINAKQLKQQHATSILVVVKGTSNELFSELVESVQKLMRNTRYPLYVDYLDEDANEVLRAMQLCREKKPLGILFMGGNNCNFRSDFDKIQIPCLLLTNNASSLSFPNLSSVCVDDHQACRCAMDSLIALGHRRIVVVGGDRDTSEISRLRYEGCLESLRSHGIAFDEELDYQGVRFSYDGGYQATSQLLARGRRFTALFAECDVMAIGAIRALRDHGLRVPEDVSVMGYDGLPLGSYMVPKLSTIAQPVQTLAQRSVEILTACIEGAASRHETVPFTLFQQESTRRVDAPF